MVFLNLVLGIALAIPNAPHRLRDQILLGLSCSEKAWVLSSFSSSAYRPLQLLRGSSTARLVLSVPVPATRDAEHYPDKRGGLGFYGCR